MIYEVIGNMREKIRRLPRLDDRHLVAIWVISRPVTEIDADQLVPIGVRCRRGNWDLGRLTPRRGATLTFRDIEFLRLFDSHRRERIDQPGAGRESAAAAGPAAVAGIRGPLADMVQRVDRAILDDRHAGDDPDHQVHGIIVILVDAMAFDEWIDRYDIDAKPADRLAQNRGEL